MKEEVTRLRLTHRFPDDFSWSVFHDLADELWAGTRGNRRWKADLAGLDFATHRFDFAVRTSVLKRSIRSIEDLLLKHGLRERVTIEVLQDD